MAIHRQHETLIRSTDEVIAFHTVLEATAVGAILAGPPFAIFSLLPDHLRTVLAVKGSLRRAQQRRALDRSGPFYSKPSHQEGKAHCGRGATWPPFWPLFSPPPTR